MALPDRIGGLRVDRDVVHLQPSAATINARDKIAPGNGLGTVTRCFDTPSSELPYPAGYEHDLSLVTAEQLPEIISPPGMGRVTGWASYEDALDGKPVFLMRCNTVAPSGREYPSLEGMAVNNATRQAIIDGAEYYWLGKSYTACIIWRALPEDFKTAEWYSGAVLCLGERTDPEVQAVVFQNFQSHMWAKHIQGERLPRLPECDLNSFKAGFMLPSEIRESEIIMGTAPATRKERTDTEEQKPVQDRRHNLSAP
ncbi:hypothetical protein AJ79_04954 [Helicocarpus griseus UAMH5409]|uniref:Uncharacterized protein n=1 Tax=Helicocarpus griseus UAMH5409 TaxID=1447875 RepID=A0A2B7XRW5_9EURO|nr:hypothetical protein AJ79_04954 [Helicocarpus griseus UAMH5409]